MTSNEAVTNLIQGQFNSIVKTNASRYYAWGDVSGGQLGLTLYAPTVATTVSWAVELFGNVPTKRIGLLSISDKSLVVVTDGCDYTRTNTTIPTPSTPCGVAGTLYAFGNNSLGQLGDTTQTSRTLPVLVDSTTLGSSTISSVKLGPVSSYAITTDGQLYAWGSNQQRKIVLQ